MRFNLLATLLVPPVSAFLPPLSRAGALAARITRFPPLQTSPDDEDDRRRLEEILGGRGTNPLDVVLSTKQQWQPREAKPALRASRAAEKTKLAIQDENVPEDQQPAQELEDLKGQPLFLWATQDTGSFLASVGKLYAGVFLFISTPITVITYDPASQLLPAIATANFGTMAFVLCLLIRVWVGWNYVGDRLKNDVGYYEESGWFDGFMSVKPEQVRQRDKLLYNFQVKPALKRVSRVTGAAVAALVASALLLTAAAPEDPYTFLSPDYLSQLQSDDGRAAAELSRSAGKKSNKPTYCEDRYYRARAGASGC